MRQVDIDEAKTHLSHLLESVEAGEDIILTRGGKPIARLTRFIPEAPPKRAPGRLKGRIIIHPGFYETDPDLEHAFTNGALWPGGKKPG